ncbi:MAG TPA: hypothetical protein PK093_08690, partial [Phycisphaerae bacterium]|nr:hypothetical protein [Phycisphaerae bacterium]
MIVHAICRRSRLDGVFDEYHYQLFHGAAWRDGVRSQIAKGRFIDSGPQSKLVVVRNVYGVPPVYEPGRSLVVSEPLRDKLGGLPGLEFDQVSYMRLFSLPYAKGEFDQNLNMEWVLYSERHSLDDDDWFLLTQVDDISLHWDAPPYFELITMSPSRLEGRYPEAREFRHTLAYAHLSEQMLLENAVIPAGHGYLVSPECFSIMDEYIDRDFFA